MAITLNTKVYNWAQYDSNAVSQYLETAGGFPTSFSLLTNKVTPVGPGKTRKVKWKLAVPTVATVDTGFDKAGTVLQTEYITVEFEVAASGTLVQRTDLLNRLKSLVLTAEFAASINTLVQPSS